MALPKILVTSPVPCSPFPDGCSALSQCQGTAAGQGSAAMVTPPGHTARTAHCWCLPEAAWRGGLLLPASHRAGWESSKRTRAAASAWLARTDTGGLGTYRLYTHPQHRFLHNLCHVLSCAGEHGVRFSLSLPFVQAHSWVVCASPCPNSVSQRLVLQWVRNKCKESYFVQPS